VETWLKCNSYLFAFNFRLLIKLNIHCGFEYKNGYLSFGQKGLSYGFSITYFDKINGKMFCEKIKFYRQIIHKYMLVLITIVITTLTTHNIKIPWMVHHIQTKRLIHLQQHKNPNPKHRKPKHLYKKKIAKQKLCFRVSSPKWFDSHRMGLYPMTNIPNPIHIWIG
jgi:hypothetical protein